MFATEIKQHLTGALIPFWHELRDDRHGGFYGYIGYDLELDKEAVKGLHFKQQDSMVFFQCLSDAGRRNAAFGCGHAFLFLKEHCLDREYGGVYWSLDYKQYYIEQEKLDKLISRKNQKSSFYNGIYDRYEYPVLTREFAPVYWRYDLDEETNPYFMERLGINAVMNSGAVYLDGKYYLVVRVEGNDRKSFFAVAESETGIDGFRFWDYPVVLTDTCPEETNVYDMRLTQHEDGWIYGIFCSESKDRENSDLSAAVAEAGIVRTKDLKTWERMDNLKTLQSPQQRNVTLHPEFVDGKYAFYTRPMDGFIETGSGGGIGFGLCEDIEHAVIDEEKIISKRIYHTLTESKNGAGAPPIKGKKCWIHISHGVRNTAAGLRYVLYVYGTELKNPSKVIAEPSGVFLVPLGNERVGDVSNVVFTNGAIARENGDIYIYYASCDTRMREGLKVGLPT